jgi:hypothetical protein
MEQLNKYEQALFISLLNQILFTDFERLSSIIAQVNDSDAYTLDIKYLND